MGGNVEILLTEGAIVTQDEDRRIIKNQDVFIKDGKIELIGKNLRENADLKINCRGKVIIPGLINLHTHSPMTLLRGYADDMLLENWLKEKIWPIESNLKAKDVYYGALLACIEMVKSGTTSFLDMYFFMDEVAKACKEVGIRGFLSPGILEFGTPEVKDVQDQMKMSKEFIDKWRGDELITPVLGPHSIYACSKDTLLEIKHISEEKDALINIHVSETRKEVVDSEKKFGMRPVEYLDGIGFLCERVIAAHCVWLTRREVSLMAKKDVKVAHNPISNMKLASGGVMPLPEMLEDGVTVGLGTDGAASNNNLDMFEEMKVAAILHKAHRWDPRVANAQEVFDMATLKGALALGRTDLGSIEVSKTADLVILDEKSVRLRPLHNVISHLVYSAQGSDVWSTIVNGRLTVFNGRVLGVDEEEVLLKVEERITRLLDNSS